MAKYQQYEKYKEVDVEWADAIPVHWKTASLSKLFMIKAGGDLQVNLFSDTKTEEYQYPIYTNANDSRAIYGYTKTPNFPANTITVSGRGEVGFAVYRNHEFDAIIRLLVLIPLVNCDGRYFSHFINEVIDFNVQSSAIGQLSTLQISPYKVAIPSYQEQSLISDYLDHETAQIDTLIDKQQTLIQLLKEKRQAVISHAVTKGLNPDAPMKDSGVEWLGEVPEHWEVWKFQHIAPIITCGIASTPTYVDEDEGMPFLSAQNIRDNKLSLHKYNYIPYQLHEHLTKYRRPEMGDLLVTRVGAGIGDACVIDIEMEFSIYVSLTHIRVNPLIGLNKFVMYFFGSDYCKYLNYQGTVTGGGVGNLNVGNVERYKIPLPDLDEQANIVHYLETESDRFDSLVKKAEQAIQLMQERRTALISAAVTGKIDVRGWQASN